MLMLLFYVIRLSHTVCDVRARVRSAVIRHSDVIVKNVNTSTCALSTTWSVLCGLQ